MKYLIVGRTASGKDTLAGHLQKRYGWKFVKSYATRDKRTPDEDSHIFITHKEAAAIPDSDKVATTKIENKKGRMDEYFATRQQVQNADAYIIDPNGVKELLANMPEETFHIIYIKADEAMRRASAIDRATDRYTASKIFDTRNASEKDQFDQFEKDLETKTFGRTNCPMLQPVENTYKDEWMERTAYELNSMRRIMASLTDMVKDLAHEKILRQDENGHIIMVMADNREIPLTPEQFAAHLYGDDEGLSTCTLEWLCLPKSHMVNSNRTNGLAETTLTEYVVDMTDSMHKTLNANQLNDLMTAIVNDETLWNTFNDQLMSIINEETEEN